MLPITYALFDLYAAYEAGMWYESGSWLDQPAWYTEGMSAIKGIMGQIQRDELKRNA